MSTYKEKRSVFRVQGYLDQEDNEKFEEKCHNERKTASMVVRQLIKRWINEK